MRTSSPPHVQVSDATGVIVKCLLVYDSRQKIREFAWVDNYIDTVRCVQMYDDKEQEKERSKRGGYSIKQGNI